MVTFAVEFAPEAAQQLEELEEYIGRQGSPNVASAYVDAIVAYCESL
jgi:plasmid stabilization system protein ParE